MNIRITYGKLKYKIKRFISSNKFRKVLYATKVLSLRPGSFFRICFKPKKFFVVNMSANRYYSITSLKEIAIMKYIYGNLVFLHNEDYSVNSINCKKLINEYYLKLTNGGQ